MKYSLLLLVIVKTLHTYGFGFQSNMPFQMHFEIPSFPSMNAMPFPAIFNPMEEMERETVEPETRGLDMDDISNVTTKNNTEVKDGFKITTITRNGPGFHSYIKEYEKEGNGTMNGTSGGMDMSKMIGGPNLFKIMQQLRNAGRQQRESKCKKCGKGKFCDPIFHLCRKKFSEGRTCMFQKQCGKRLKCQWGKCQRARAGDPGTFCKGNSQCNGNACCRNTPGAFHLMCIPQQSEGAICGLKRESFADVLYIVKRSVAPSCAPCENGLKCADTGDSKFKRCVHKYYVVKAADEFEDNNPSNALDIDYDNAEDEASGKEEYPMKGVPPQVPSNNPQNPAEEQGGKWQPRPNNSSHNSVQEQGGKWQPHPNTSSKNPTHDKGGKWQPRPNTSSQNPVEDEGGKWQPRPNVGGSMNPEEDKGGKWQPRPNSGSQNPEEDKGGKWHPRPSTPSKNPIENNGSRWQPRPNTSSKNPIDHKEGKWQPGTGNIDEHDEDEDDNYEDERNDNYSGDDKHHNGVTMQHPKKNAKGKGKKGKTNTKGKSK